uniref:Filament-like plant protein 7 n=1 Tax=Cajanus cajan TaxID=3821 RepID=A0A151RSR9_CAJCA|nr:Filament-like plant protein 7 [Cajanus cajan]
MNHKPWLWRKRSMEKTIFAADKVVSPSRPIEEEVLKTCSFLYVSVFCKSETKRSSKSLNEKLATVLLDSHSGDDPLAKHVQKPQQEIRGKDKTQHQVESVEDLGEKASAETVSSADTTLQEPLQPPSCDQEEQKQKLCSAIPKISKEHEKIQKELEEKLRETSKRIDDLTAENTHLSNALLTKEKSIGDLVKCKQETDAEFSTLMARLDNTEKENSFLRYEFHVLEKEIEIRKEEMDYSRQYADASHKQYLECSQKASKLEAECQKLRLLLQKRSPGSADMDEENKALKRILNNKNSELESSRLMYAETASRLSQAEILLRKISENQKSMELASNEVPYMSCMDDFVEMEKRAIVSIDTPKRGCFSDISGRELVPVQQDHLGFSERKQEIQFKNVTEKSFDWLQIVLNAILEEKFISKRSLYELLDDIKIALDCINHPTACKSETTKKSRHPGESDSFKIRKLKDDLRSTKTAKKDLEEKLVSVTDESQNLTKQCQEAQNNIRGLESEIESLKEAKETIEDQIEKQKIISEDLDTQLTIAQAKLNDIFQKFSSLEVELEDKKNSCEELEATCLELQLQLESIAKKESPTYGRYEVEKIYQTGWEITTASSKLAECQETILNLGKQLKALASSNEVAHFDKVVSTTSTMANPTQKKNLIKRSSLRNHMQAEDEAKGGKHKSVQTEETKSDKDVQRPPVLHSENEKVMQSPSNAPETCLTSEQNDRSKVTGSMAIVPSKRQVGFGFLRKLLSRRHKGRGKGAKLLAKA